MAESNSTDSNILQCYNKGCGKKYHAGENSEDSCCHHPGVPVFHDAYKGWSCCKKKCTDFTEFLNIKGCTTSFHNNTKPPEPEKPKQTVDLQDVIVVKPKVNNTVPTTERPDKNLPMERLPHTIAPSLHQSLVNKMTKNIKEVELEKGKIEIGTTCKNSGCKKSYEGELSNTETCIFHDGVPIFHEGLKYWTCCKRKTTDFDSFLDQVGCKTGLHTWIKKEDPNKVVQCRTDWHQTDSFVYISLYSKGCVPDNSFVEANPVKLKTSLTFDSGSYVEELTLFGVIDVKQSAVHFAATKVEIKLKKANVLTWKDLSQPNTEKP